MHEHDHCCCHDEHDSCHDHSTHGHSAHEESGCGSCCSGGCHDNVIYITEDEHAFLTVLSQTPFLPLTRFITASSKSDDVESVALAPVYMTDKAETMDAVKKTGKTLRDMEEKGLITLDYDMPLEQGDYSVYEQSALYQLFCDTVHEAKNKDGFLFDQPVLETGSIALTAMGRAALDSLENME